MNATFIDHLATSLLIAMAVLVLAVFINAVVETWNRSRHRRDVQMRYWLRYNHFLSLSIMGAPLVGFLSANAQTAQSLTESAKAFSASSGIMENMSQTFAGIGGSMTITSWGIALALFASGVSTFCRFVYTPIRTVEYIADARRKEIEG